jgi:hypothetical protein
VDTADAFFCLFSRANKNRTRIAGIPIKIVYKTQLNSGSLSTTASVWWVGARMAALAVAATSSIAEVTVEDSWEDILEVFCPNF